MRPGFFNVWGTILAIILLAVGFSGLSLAGAPFWMEPVFDGMPDRGRAPVSMERHIFQDEEG